MKKLILIYLFFFPLFVSAKNNYEKFIEKHDVTWELKNLSSEFIESFWTEHATKNPAFQKFFKDIKKGKGAEKEAFVNFNSIPKFDIKTNPLVLDSCETLIRSLKKAVGYLNGLQICIIDDDSFNAFTTLSEEGHVIGINSGLLSRQDMTDKMVIGVLAHEYVHAVMMHILQSEYSKAKRKRRNDLLGGIAQGLNAISAGIDSYTAAVTGSKVDISSQLKEIDRIEESKKQDLYKYKYAFNREEELEADLIAYRFMEWSGYGGENYIEALRLIKSIEKASGLERRSTEIDDDHPLTSERIMFLEFVKAHPELGRKD